MRSLVRLLSAAVLLAAPGVGLAADPVASISAAYQACIDNSGGVTAVLRACAATEDSTQEARLNANYQALMAKLPPDRQAQLRDAERAWLAFRKSDCAFAGGFFAGGTFEPVAADDCVVTRTAQRADELGDDLSQASVN